MIILLLVSLLLFAITTKYNIKGFNERYLSKINTTTINGIFVLLVFFSHFKAYITSTSILDASYSKVLGIIGQLMVTTFLFYSGFGIAESIKNKQNYAKNMFKNRFLPLFLNFSIVISIYILMNMILGIRQSTEDILLSFIGWASIGNSNWYIFITFIMYILIIGLYFNVDNTNKKSIAYRNIAFTIICIAIVFVLGFFKESYFVNTLLCFPTGLWWSYYKDKIDSLLFNNKNWIITLFIVAFLFIAFKLLYKLIITANIVYNLYAICFAIIVTLITMKFENYNKVFHFFGEHVFWIYILQRIPMILFNGLISNNFLYFTISFVFTIAISYLMRVLSNKIWIKES